MPDPIDAARAAVAAALVTYAADERLAGLSRRVRLAVDSVKADLPAEQAAGLDGAARRLSTLNAIAIAQARYASRLEVERRSGEDLALLRTWSQRPGGQ